MLHGSNPVIVPNQLSCQDCWANSPQHEDGRRRIERGEGREGGEGRIKKKEGNREKKWSEWEILNEEEGREEEKKGGKEKGNAELRRRRGGGGGGQEEKGRKIL